MLPRQLRAGAHHGGGRRSGHGRERVPAPRDRGTPRRRHRSRVARPFAGRSAHRRAAGPKPVRRARAERQRIFDTYARAMNASSAKTSHPTRRFRALSPSEQTTFDAITHALIALVVDRRAGQPLGTALDLVAGLDRIAGEQAGRSGDQQFRILRDAAAERARHPGPIARVRPEPGEHGVPRRIPALVPSGHGRPERPVLHGRRRAQRRHRRRLSREQGAPVAVQRPSHFVEFGCAGRRQRAASRAALERVRQLVVGNCSAL